MSEVLDQQKYSDFVSSHQKNIMYLAKRHSLEKSDVENDLYVLWASQVDHYSSTHRSGASLATYLFAALDIHLGHQTFDPAHSGLSFVEDAGLDSGIQSRDESPLTEIGFSSIPNSTSDAKQGGKSTSVALDGLSYFARNSAIGAEVVAPSAEDQLEDLITRSYADIAFEDVIKAHAVYASTNYRSVIDGLLCGLNTDEIAIKSGYTKRRVYQMFIEIVDIVQKKDVIRNSKLVKVQGDETIDAEPVRYRAIDSLEIVDQVTQIDRQQVINLAISYIDFEMHDIVVIDQFNRVLIGTECVIAAKLLGITAVKTVRNPVAEGTQSRSIEAFARKRAAMLGIAPRTRELIRDFQQYLDEGTISELVAARLSHLPSNAQHAVRTGLGRWLIRMLGLAEVNKLIVAHADDRLKEAVQKLRKALIETVGELG